MKRTEAMHWIRVLRTRPLTRAEQNELAMIIDEAFVHPTRGRPYRTALERTNKRFTTGLLEELLQEEMVKGLSRRAAADKIVKALNRNAKAHGLSRGLTVAGVLKRIERSRQRH